MIYILCLMSEEQLKAEGADPVAIAKAAGFSITTEDLKEHRQTLSDDELEGVAGGGRGREETGVRCIPFF
ncbi:Nif11-like leader peptide family RiPP precursor [Synechococcus sp. AH-707-D15]|nr:Nif11-like leader peptide family RiPP precursor [Synechococcus sp. AH-707-D15]